MGRGGPRSSGNRIDGAPRGPRGSRGAPRSGGNKIDGGATAGGGEGADWPSPAGPGISRGLPGPGAAECNP